MDVRKNQVLDFFLLYRMEEEDINTCYCIICVCAFTYMCVRLLNREEDTY